MPDQKYRVLERIDSGGMAEVFRGVASSIEGFDKVVAIKRVLPNLTRKRQFVQMFLDEARLSLVLNHANIVQVFDLGHADDTYFIVMEYVDGTNLRKLLNDAIRQGRPIPVPQAVYIAAEVCKGLAYAHDKKDAENRDLGIVHRDISPPNILLSVQGEVKITDFGLAKARSQVEITDPGFVKGKFAYLSPEAAYGEKIDARTDIFAVGIVLWEMLAGRRLFAAETDNRTLERIRQARVPELNRHNPDVPAELEEIIGRALARDKSLRYQTAAQLGNDLTQFLFDHNLKVSSFEIAQLVSDVTGDAEKKPKKRTSIDIEEMIQAEIERFISVDEEESAGETQSPTTENGGSLEDPSTWFDGDVSGEMPAASGVEVKSLQVGPRIDTTSMMIPIDVVNQVVEEARARGDLDWLDDNQGNTGAQASPDQAATGAAVAPAAQIAPAAEAGPAQVAPAEEPGPSAQPSQPTEPGEPTLRQSNTGALVMVVVVVLVAAVLAYFLLT